MVEGDVSPGDEAKAMWAGIKEKSLALRQKLGKLIAVANSKLSDHSLAQVTFIVSFLFQEFHCQNTGCTKYSLKVFKSDKSTLKVT